MATTTNYGWTTPDDTALVKDGASAIRTLGSSVDTSVKALNPGTTAGDVDYYTAATTKARIGIGSTGQVLTVNSGIPSWQTPSSGSLTLLSTTSLSGATTTISSISGSYNNLFGIIYGVSNATATGVFRIAPNGATTSCNERLYDDTPSDIANGYYLLSSAQNPLFTSTSNIFTFTISNYASSSVIKPISHNSSFVRTGTTWYQNLGCGSYNATTAITSLVFSNAGGNHSTGTVLLYGVK
jgi:hypothetical protein